MKVVYIELNEPLFAAAKRVTLSSHDGCFSIGDLAVELNVPLQEVRSSLNHYYDWGFCTRMAEDWNEVPTTDERWVLIQIPLLVGKIYEVLCIEGGSYRLLTDPEAAPYGNEPVLFSQHCFNIVDFTEPDSWICEIDGDGERYCSPPEWRGAFFEDYHDGKQEARELFLKVLQRDYSETFQMLSEHFEP